MFADQDLWRAGFDEETVRPQVGRRSGFHLRDPPELRAREAEIETDTESDDDDDGYAVVRRASQAPTVVLVSAPRSRLVSHPREAPLSRFSALAYEESRPTVAVERSRGRLVSDAHEAPPATFRSLASLATFEDEPETESRLVAGFVSAEWREVRTEGHIGAVLLQASLNVTDVPSMDELSESSGSGADLLDAAPRNPRWHHDDKWIAERTRPAQRVGMFTWEAVSGDVVNRYHYGGADRCWAEQVCNSQRVVRQFHRIAEATTVVVAWIRDKAWYVARWHRGVPLVRVYCTKLWVSSSMSADAWTMLEPLDAERPYASIFGLTRSLRFRKSVWVTVATDDKGTWSHVDADGAPFRGSYRKHSEPQMLVSRAAEKVQSTLWPSTL